MVVINQGHLGSGSYDKNAQLDCWILDMSVGKVTIFFIVKLDPINPIPSGKLTLLLNMAIYS